MQNLGVGLIAHKPTTIKTPEALDLGYKSQAHASRLPFFVSKGG